jgi:hypothetical protein
MSLRCSQLVTPRYGTRGEAEEQSKSHSSPKEEGIATDEDADTYGACATTQHPILIMPIADETFSLVHVDGQGMRSDSVAMAHISADRG